MPDVIRALAISASILLLVVLGIIGVSIVAVRRGEQEMSGGHHGSEPVIKEAAAVPAGKAAAVAAPDEINVMQILLLGTGLFVITVIALLALSLLQHM